MGDRSRSEGPGEAILQDEGSQAPVGTPNTAHHGGSWIVAFQRSSRAADTSTRPTEITEEDKMVATECYMHATYNAGVI
jgi:hypothetical protein